MEERQKPRLLDQVRNKIRYLHYSRSTEKTYVLWIKQYILYHDKKHPKEMGADELTAFLNYLATVKNVSASTQNQALNAIMFLYKRVLEIPIDELKQFTHAKRPHRLPVVLTKEEVARVLTFLDEPYRTIVHLLYGSGLRLMECLRLRVLDVDFSRGEIFIRAGKGQKDRVTMLPKSAVAGLQGAISRVRQLHQHSLAAGIEHVDLPCQLIKKYPDAGKELKWQFIFASKRISLDIRSGKRGRHHIHNKHVSRNIHNAVKRAGILKHVTTHTFRHSFATHLLEIGYDIRTVQELLGHKHVNTTMIYTHVLNKGGKGVESPLDTLPVS